MIPESRERENFLHSLAEDFAQVHVMPMTPEGDITVYCKVRAKSSYHLPPSKALRCTAIYVIDVDGNVKETR